MTLLVAAIIGREITMSALREWAASCSQEAHQAVAVSSWGKWKTATQVGLHALAASVSFVIRHFAGLLPVNLHCAWQLREDCSILHRNLQLCCLMQNLLHCPCKVWWSKRVLVMPLSYCYNYLHHTCASDVLLKLKGSCCCLQMTSISLLLATSGNISNQALEVAATIAAPLLCVATFLTLWSLADYMRGVWPYM